MAGSSPTSGRPAGNVNPGIASLTPYQTGKPMEELTRELGIRDVIKLASNENPRGPGPRVREALDVAMRQLSRYPDGGGTVLKRALAGHLVVEEACLTLGNGSNDVLELVARAFATPGSEVVYAEHAFAVYALVTQAVGARAVGGPARDWAHELDAMAAAVTPATRVVFVANPNNPTGTWIDREAFERCLISLPESVVVVVPPPSQPL